MKSGFVVAALLVCAFVHTTSCSDYSGNNSPEEWLGRYTYAEPANAANIIISRELTITKLNGEYLSIVNTSSATGNSSYDCGVTVNGNELFVIYKKSFSQPAALYNGGDTLFSLMRQGESLQTNWKKLVPASFTNRETRCNCFSFRGVNENGNTISQP